MVLLWNFHSNLFASPPILAKFFGNSVFCYGKLNGDDHLGRLKKISTFAWQ
jgi:hypothetical protein